MNDYFDLKSKSLSIQISKFLVTTSRLKYFEINCFKKHIFADCMKLIDQGMKSTTEILEAFWRYDRKTTFMVVSKKSPLLFWGAGIKKGLRISNVHPTDLTVLISTLLGTSIPCHANGNIPFEMLDIKMKQQALANLANAEHLFQEILNLDTNNANSVVKWLYNGIDIQAIESLKKRILQVMAKFDSKSAFDLTQDWISKSRKGTILWKLHEHHKHIPFLLISGILTLVYNFIALAKLEDGYLTKTQIIICLSISMLFGYFLSMSYLQGLVLLYLFILSTEGVNLIFKPTMQKIIYNHILE